MKTSRYPPIARVSLLVVLMVLGAGASAREVRLQGPNGESGACPDATEANEAEPVSSKRAEPGRQPKGKPASSARGGSDSTARPRWHSFLPGMFR